MGQEGSAASDVVRHWAVLRQSGYDIEKIYRASMEAYLVDATPENQIRVV
jgi:hypothetical protein